MSNQSLTLVSDDNFERAARALIAAKGSENTREAYTIDLKRWIDFCRQLGIHPRLASLEATTAFRNHLMRNGSKSVTRRALAAMSGIYRILLAAHVVTANPFHSSVLAWPAGMAVNKTRLVPEDVAEAMITNAVADSDKRRGARDAAILRLLYDTGLRRASVASLVRANYRDGILYAIVKGDKETENQLPPQTIEAIDRWLAVAPVSEAMFPGSAGRFSINPLTINKIIGERAKAVGATGVHPHCFRAAFATACYNAGMPEYEIQAAMHHSDPSTTRRYDRGSRGKAVATQLSEFRKGKAKP